MLSKLFQNKRIFFLEKALIGICFLFLVYILYIFFIQKQTALSVSKDSKIVSDQSNEAGKPYDYYRDEFKRRDIFGLLPPETTDQEIAKITSDFSQNLKIVGIVIGHPPEAIIEDGQTNQTYFLNPGDQFKEGKVQSILADKVLFQYRGKTIQLVQPE